MKDIKRKVFEMVIFMKKVCFQLFFALAACYNISHILGSFGRKVGEYMQRYVYEERMRERKRKKCVRTCV